MCYIGVDFDAVLTSTDKEKNCELPDGNITVGAWRFRCATVLFQPCFTGEGASGIHVISFQTKFDDDIRKNLYANVVSSKKQSQKNGKVKKEKSNTVYVDAKENENEPQSGKC